MSRHPFRPLRWLLALLCAAGLVGAVAAPVRAQNADANADGGLFDRLFGNDPASERAGQAADGLALPALFADGRLIADTIALHDLGPGAGACVAIAPLLDALELAWEQPGETADITLALPEPRRSVTIPAAALLPSPSGGCLPLADVPAYLPASLTHDTVSQRLTLAPSAALPVLMRLAREERQARLRPETARPAYALLARPERTVELWSADLGAGIALTPQGRQISGSVLASGAVLGLAGRLSLAATQDGRITPGFTLSDARDTPELLGPLKARSLALGDIAAPAQPLIADALSGRGLVVSSRAPWRADLVDTITLTGPLPQGWEAELWHEERLVAVTREGDAAGQWQFGDIPVRIGENRWVVRLYGPNGEVDEQVFTRLVGTEMNAENEVGYSFGVVDGGRPLLGESLAGEPAGPTAFASLDWGMASDLTARLDLRAGTAGDPAVAVGFNGSLGGGLWAVTGARDREGGLGGAVRLARRIGAQDVTFDLADHGRDDGPGLPPQVREFERVMAISGQGRIGLGRLSLPWQARYQSGALRRGGSREVAATRLVLPMADWQANLAFGAVREGSAPWLGTAALGVTARQGEWRLRSGIAASDRNGWRIDSAAISAARRVAGGNLALDLDWQADSGRIGGGVTFARQFGPLGLSASAGREGDGWRAGIGLTLGLFRGADRWRTAPAGVARSGAVLAEMFVDDDGDGTRDPTEAGVEGGRFIVGAALRREETDASGAVLIGGIAPGPAVDVETQLSSLTDFTLRPARSGDRLELRPGEIRHLSMPLRPTGSIEVQVVLVAGDQRTPRSGVTVVLRDPQGREAARGRTDFDGFALFEGLAFGAYRAEAAGQSSAVLTVTRDTPDTATRLLIAPA
ncbi:hypothetical protein [Erythrobacter sp. BLCC-B19]|uniref:hypothetical protein n=1 Tax=Erythrobacter sp. BLCC-B19 TaxID=3025315 RepID=UPI00236159B6|nr:hypothetical protein [Erythrobacter sp. BLCC-B19]WDA41743.1 hypothetical protein PS060_02760 [Erythrobacter sp. BLCC-B19]